MAEVPKLDEKALWEKVEQSIKTAGREVIKLVLTLLYCMHDSDTPMWAKATIIGSLLYFVGPLDAVPDFLPGGFLDDLAVLGAAVAVVVAFIKPEHRARAQEWVDEMFGPEVVADDGLVPPLTSEVALGPAEDVGKSAQVPAGQPISGRS